jgi:hypothetical protein
VGRSGREKKESGNLNGKWNIREKRMQIGEIKTKGR